MVLVADPADDQVESITKTTTLLLFGPTGNGKSATGNSILGRKAFESKSTSFRSAAAAAVTTTTLLQTAHLEHNHLDLVRVIDTPGLCEVVEGCESVVSEVVRCAEFAREDGIHAFVFVLSTRSMLSVEELAALGTLKTLFGDKMADYMILVITGGDDLEADGESLQEYLGQSCPHALKELVAMCENRCISFDNRTSDKGKKQDQVKLLLDLVHEVMNQNDGKPYKDEMFDALKKNSITLNQDPEVATCLSSQQISELKKKLKKSYNQQLKSITKMMKETAAKLEKQAAAAEGEANADAAELEKTVEEIKQLSLGEDDVAGPEKPNLMEAQAHDVRRNNRPRRTLHTPLKFKDCAGVPNFKNYRY